MSDEWARELAREHGVTVEEARAVLAGAVMVDAKSLYVSDDDLCRLLFGKAGVEERQTLAALTLEGLPAPDNLTGRRYWPSVRAWFDKRHGVETDTPGTVDGEERW